MRGIPVIVFARVVFALIVLATPAQAQWTRVAEVPSSDMFSLTANGDTIAAGLVSTIVISTNGGATWRQSATVAHSLNEISTILVHNGRLYAGTDRSGVFVSDNLGVSWTDYSQGLAGLGTFDIVELIVRGDSLYLATEGGDAWVRNLRSGAWTLFGSNTLQNFQAGNMTAIAAGGSRLFAAGGFNGTVFVRDPGQPDWSLSLLFNDRFAPGLAGLSAIWTGRRWVVGSNIGIFHSADGREPWTYVDFGIHPTLFVGFAMHGADLYASHGAGGGSLITLSHDDGITWQNLDTLFSVGVYQLAIHESTLYAGRVDGLWRRSIGNTAGVPRGEPRPGLAFAVAGSPLISDQVRFTFELPEAGPIAIEVFDVAGRRVGNAIRETRPAGHGEAGWDAGGLTAGVYLARITAAAGHATAHLVRTSGRR